MYATVNRTAVARMFISLGLANKIVNAIVDAQGFDNPQALSILDEEGVEQLVSAIYKPRGMKRCTQNPSINILR